MTQILPPPEAFAVFERTRIWSLLVDRLKKKQQAHKDAALVRTRPPENFHYEVGCSDGLDECFRTFAALKDQAQTQAQQRQEEAQSPTDDSATD